MFELSQQTRNSISSHLKLPFSKILSLSLDEEIAIASKIYGSPIRFSKNRCASCRNSYLAKGKFKTLEEVEEKIARIK